MQNHSFELDELEQLRSENEHHRQQDQQRRKQQEASFQEQVENYRRSASDWREALQKQATLYEREAQRFLEINEKTGVDSFAVSSIACVRACEIWDELAALHQLEIAELSARIKQIRDSIRVEVAQRLRAETVNQPGADDIESFVTSSLEEGSDPEDWLQW